MLRALAVTGPKRSPIVPDLPTVARWIGKCPTRIAPETRTSRSLKLEALFPDSAQVHALGPGSAADATVWRCARAQRFTSVTKDADFQERAKVVGYAPKVVWVRRGNRSTREIEAIPRARVEALRELEEDKDAGVLSLL